MTIVDIEWLKWKNSSLHVYIDSFVVCSCTLPMLLYGMPIDLVIVIKKIQHNASFSFYSYAGGICILLACGPNTTWFMPKCSGCIFKIEVCMKNEDGTFRHSNIRPLHGLEMSGIIHCHIPEHYIMLTSSVILSAASSWVLGISWICSSPSTFFLFVFVFFFALDTCIYIYFNYFFFLVWVAKFW